jgi:hypothetical protein
MLESMHKEFHDDQTLTAADDVAAGRVAELG